MKKLFCLCLLLLSASAHAYTAQELRDDCLAAEDFYNREKSTDVYHSVKVARCVSYLAGFADGYGIGDYLADKVGVGINAFCLPREPDLSRRLVRSVLAHLDHLPPETSASTSMIVASALAKTFPCADSLEPKK
jgi:hypothetical protein